MPLSKLDGAEMAEKLVPFDPRLTEADASYLVAECNEWSTEYRRCVAGALSDVDLVGCNQAAGPAGGGAWVGLPHVKAWLDAVGEKTGAAYAKAVDAATDARLAAEKLERSLPAGDPRIASAKAAADRAQTLASECGANPLAKPVCFPLFAK
jgi:hypothetical protein